MFELIIQNKRALIIFKKIYKGISLKYDKI